MSDDVFDYIIVGSGVAAICLLDGLKNLEGLRIGVVESGRKRLSLEHQYLNVEGSINPHYYPLASTRIRQFGGTANHWSGVCAPIPNNELENWSDSGFKDYYSRASTALGVEIEGQGEQLAPGINKFSWGLANPKSVLELGARIYNELSNVSWMFDSTVVGLSSSGGRVDGVFTRTMDGSKKLLRSKAIIFCCGGVENARLLLSFFPEAAESYPIGEFFCEHPHSEVGIFYPSSKGINFINKSLSSSPEAFSGVMLQHGKHDSVGMFLTPREVDSRYDHISTKLSKLKKTFSDKQVDAQALLDVGEILKSPFSTIDYLKTRFNYRNVFSIKLMSSQHLYRNNRLELVDQLDKHGLPRVNLKWRVTDEDKESIRASVEKFVSYLVNMGYGSVRYHDWYSHEEYYEHSFVGGFHHLCTTRKGRPGTAVLDTDNQLLWKENIYVLGSSCFEFPSFVNPTLTIAAMSYEFSEKISRL